MINDRLHDKLQQLANGELSPQEEASVRQELAKNPEAQSLFAEYRQLKEDMNFLQDVPPDQLSKERLRARLLGEALKPERPAPVWTWLWMPTLAASMAFILYFNRTKTDVMPAVIGSPPVTAPLALGAVSSPVSRPFQGSPAQVVASQAAPPPSSLVHSVVPSAATGHSVAPEKGEHHHAKHADDPAATDDNSDSGGLLDAIKNSTENSIATISPKVTALSDTNSDSIVVISNSVDADTGAQHATEETASDVLVGG